jgi:hypothetical protein
MPDSAPTLVSLQLRNYRGFRDHTISFRPSTILVGRNNAGKSTIVEALRFVSLITSRYRHLTFSPAPGWSTFPRGHRGVSPSLGQLEFTWEGLFHQYDDPPAEINATFSDRRRVAIQLGPREQIHGVLMDTDGRPVADQRIAGVVEFGRLATMPQVAPLRLREVRLAEDYVRGAVDSYLAPLHFRNQLVYIVDHWRQFRELVASSWPGIVVESLERGTGLTGEQLALFLRERDFVAEVGTMGHGLQMWLQTMWFFARTPRSSMVVLDEPDVYMHADLQRRLIRMLKGRFVQSIVATHSAEIMSEVEPEDVLVVDRQCTQSGFADSLPAVQRVMETIGTAHNLQLTRLWRSRRFLIVEGDDLELLAKLHATLYPGSRDPLRNVPHVTIGGWGGWQLVLGARLTLQNAIGEDITTFCLLDRDYHATEEVTARVSEGERVGVRLHVWAMKEIENYLLVPSAIRRVIAARAGRRVNLPTVEEVASEMASAIERARGDVTDRIAEGLQATNRGMGVTRVNQQARELVQGVWATPEGALRLAPGKDVLRQLSDWAQHEFGVGVSVSRLAASMTRSEIHREIHEVLEQIESASEATH